jgi:hypothetical protein
MADVEEMERQVAAVTRKLEAVLEENAELHRQRQQLVASGVAQEVGERGKERRKEAGGRVGQNEKAERGTEREFE